MKTRMLKVMSPEDKEAVQTAGKILRRGGLVAIPTETVYGLAANALNGTAVAGIFKAKGRPQDNPLIVHVASMEEISPLTADFPPQAYALAQAYWPGPLTIIVKKSALIPDEVSAGLDTVGIRMPSHPAARAIIRAAGVPLAAPSANLSGSPSPTNAARVFSDMEGRIDAVVDGGDCGVGVESTVITVAQNLPCLLRPGGITLEQLEAVLGHVEVHPAIFEALKAGQQAASPGMKYRHYAPETKVVLLKGTAEQFCDYVNRRNDCAALCFEGEQALLHVPCVSYGKQGDAESQAHGLFEALRRLDSLGKPIAYARYPESGGVGMAVLNRLLRAAGFEVAEL